MTADLSCDLHVPCAASRRDPPPREAYGLADLVHEESPSGYP